MLVEGLQLGNHDVLEAHHKHWDRIDLELDRAFEHRVVDGLARGPEDQVDQDTVVPGLVEPAFGGLLGPHAELLQRFQRALGVFGLDHQVEVVLSGRSTPRPDG